jgi:GH43 family beta-xylosidase
MVIEHEQVLKFGGNLNNGSNAGVGYLNANNASSNVNWNICSRNLLVKNNNVLYDRASWQNTQQKSFSASSKCENSGLTKVGKNEKIRKFI